MAEWRPIGRARKAEGDGSDFLLWSEPEETMVMAYWDGEGWATYEGRYFEPTHFMPLPAPPEPTP